MLPLPDESDPNQLNLFLVAAKALGYSDSDVFAPVHAVLEAFVPWQKARNLSDEAKRELCDGYFSAMERIPEFVRRHASPTDQALFELGRLLYEVPTVLLMGESPHPVTLALRGKANEAGIPDAIKDEIDRYAKRVSSSEYSDLRSVVDQANELAIAIYQYL